MATSSKEVISSESVEYSEALAIIEKSRENAFRAVNRELILMYWEIGKYVSKKAADSSWGKSIVKDFSEHIQLHYVGIKGFSPQNIWRMKQFYEAYSENEKLSPLAREISWTNNILIIMAAKTDEEREFYLRLSHEHGYSKRELERQINSSLYERTMISAEKSSLLSRSSEVSTFRDSYVLEFLDLPKHHKERDLRKAIIANLREFILEFGKNFSLIGEEYRIQVGSTDFSIIPVLELSSVLEKMTQSLNMP